MINQVKEGYLMLMSLGEHTITNEALAKLNPDLLNLGGVWGAWGLGLVGLIRLFNCNLFSLY